MMSEKIFIHIILILGFSISVASDYQVAALIEMKTMLNDSEDQLSDWNRGQISACTWRYIECVNATSNIVRSVSLSYKGFTGTISPIIGVLKHLSSLSLAGNKITGTIPSDFGNLTGLIKLDLSNNRLTGEIPPSVGNLANLRNLILNENNLNGTIPRSLSNLANLNIVQLAANDLSGRIPDRLFNVSKYNFTGNKLNCGVNSAHTCVSGEDGSSHHTSKNLALGLGTAGGILGSIALLVVIFFFLRKHRRGHRSLDVFVDVSGEHDRRIEFGQLRRFAWRELEIATDGFSENNVLGRGGFGKVYRGVLGDAATKIAVKRLTDHERPGGEAAFLREVEMISLAVHRNLLKLIGFCATPSERLLVYPFMQNLSVAYRLRELKAGEATLDWATRKNIALGSGRGLEYLHEQCDPKIIHRDVKAANVLLDENYDAVVGDFGLAKIMDVRRTSVTTQVRGTMGHIAPEYLSTGRSSERTDVFGYGIMLLELVTGQRAIDLTRLDDEGGDVLLLDHVNKLESKKKLDAIVDRNLKGSYVIAEVEMMVRVALLCTQPSPEERPVMSQVVRMLEGEGGLTDKWEEWQHGRSRQECERFRRRFDWGEDSIYNQEDIELSGGR